MSMVDYEIGVHEPTFALAVRMSDPSRFVVGQFCLSLSLPVQLVDIVISFTVALFACILHVGKWCLGFIEKSLVPIKVLASIVTYP